MKRQTIEKIIVHCLTGKVSDDENQQLRKWLAEDESHQHFYDYVVNIENINRLYKVHSIVDVDKAWNKFLENTGNEQEKKPWRTYLRYAAAVMLLVVLGAGWWYSEYTKVTPPKIPEAVQLTMLQSRESGKQAAEVDAVLSFNGDEKEIAGMAELSGAHREAEAAEPPAPQASPLNIQESLTKEQLLAAKRITTRHDKEFWLTLDDGTLVHLNNNTHLIYPERFGRGIRNVILDGEAYFMVAKDRSRPFVVHTPQGDVRVKGTEFNVNTRTNLNNATSSAAIYSTTLSVVLIKGSISIIPTGGTPQMMKPGDMATISYNPSTMNYNLLAVNPVDTEPYVAWNTGHYVFNDCPMWKLMDVLGRWYNVQVVYQLEELRELRFMGSLNRYESIDPVITAISKSIGVGIVRKGDTVYIGE